MLSTSSSDSERSASSRVICPASFDDGEVAHAAQQSPGDARRAARAPRDLARAISRHRHAEHARAASHDQLQLLGRVEIQPYRNAEAVAQRRRQQPGARGGADEREFGEIDLHRARRRTFADDEIELEILHRRVKDFLHRRIEPVNFVDEQNVARFEIGELGGEIAGLGDDRAGGGAEIHAELARQNLRQRRLAEAGRSDEQHMIERVAARLRRLDEDLEIVARRFLAGEIGERQRAQREVRIVVAFFGRDEPAGRGGQGGAPMRWRGGCGRLRAGARLMNRPDVAI